MENVKEKAVGKEAVKDAAKVANSEKAVKKDFIEIIGTLTEGKVKDFRTGEEKTVPYVRIDNPFDKDGEFALLQPTFIGNRGMWNYRAIKEIKKAYESGDTPKIEIRVKVYLKSFYSQKTHREMAMLNFEVPNFTDDGYTLMSIVGKEVTATYNKMAVDYLNPVK